MQTIKIRMIKNFKRPTPHRDFANVTVKGHKDKVVELLEKQLERTQNMYVATLNSPTHVYWGEALSSIKSVLEHAKNGDLSVLDRYTFYGG